MKKFFLPCLLCLLVGLVTGLLYNFFSLGGIGLLPAQATLLPAVTPGTAATAPPTGKGGSTNNAALLLQGNLVLEALKSENYKDLASYVHPKRGLTFTTFSTVDAENDLTFTPEQIISAAENQTKHLWGYGHGSGEAIELTLSEYVQQYLFSADYTVAPMIGINHISSSGNSLENVAEAYPGDPFLEYYFPSQIPQNAGLDWSALKLVFSEYNGALTLVALIHSEWTI